MPEEMLASRSLNIDAEYYIRNLLIPPLSRIFNLVGADVENWYDSMPRIKRAGKYDFKPTGSGGVGGGGAGGGGGKMRIDSHFKSSHCVVCGLESATGMSSPLFASLSSLRLFLYYIFYN
jgi:DNA polymerase zeta